DRDRLAAWLAGRGLEVAESDANFVLFGRFADRHLVWRGLLDRGVLVRETGPDGWLRVSVGTPSEIAAFRQALDEVRADVRAGVRGDLRGDVATVDLLDGTRR
ncbi:MAG: aminotransferase class I/II-fold pyridoxal phosphate-dependent enzyme, partial [Actinomycetota bacterium]|nr:aminotransferase class I/II-fold pyridoxal phosphate-dependent enzyme [Actinomycetota bacterium]